MTSEPTFSAITLRIDAESCTITLSRPRKRNAISDLMLSELVRAIDYSSERSRVGIIAADGPVFCAGLNLSEQSGKSAQQALARSLHWARSFARIENGPIPWIAALHGPVIGGGLELAAATHLRIADPETSFLLPEAERGLFVGGGGAVRISRLLSVARMADMMLTANPIDSRKAEQWG